MSGFMWQSNQDKSMLLHSVTHNAPCISFKAPQTGTGFKWKFYVQLSVRGGILRRRRSSVLYRTDTKLNTFARQLYCRRNYTEFNRNPFSSFGDEMSRWTNRHLHYVFTSCFSFKTVLPTIQSNPQLFSLSRDISRSLRKREIQTPCCLEKDHLSDRDIDVKIILGWKAPRKYVCRCMFIG
jgi:hypothetical protein